MQKRRKKFIELQSLSQKKLFFFFLLYRQDELQVSIAGNIIHTRLSTPREDERFQARRFLNGHVLGVRAWLIRDFFVSFPRRG